MILFPCVIPFAFLMAFFFFFLFFSVGNGGFAPFFLGLWLHGCEIVQMWIFFGWCFYCDWSTAPTQQVVAFQSTQPCLMTLTLGTPHSKDIIDCQGLWDFFFQFSSWYPVGGCLEQNGHSSAGISGRGVNFFCLCLHGYEMWFAWMWCFSGWSFYCDQSTLMCNVG